MTLDVVFPSPTASIHGHTDFSGLWIPLVTPFDTANANAVDHGAMSRLVKRLAAQGVAGFVACGSTGEAAALDADEQLAVLDTVLAASPGLPVVMGVSGYHLPDMLNWTATLCSRRIAGLLVPAPHYVRPSQTGIVAWFTALAHASRVPLIVYDIPYRTGVTMSLPTLMQLAAHPRIVAIKDCGGDIAKTLALIADGRLQVLAGEDLQMFSTVAQGGSGAIAASGHVQTRRFVEVLRRLAVSDLAGARKLWLPLVPLIEAMFDEPNPAVIKAGLARHGEMARALRAPMQAASAEAAATLERLDAELGACPLMTRDT